MQYSILNKMYLHGLHKSPRSLASFPERLKTCYQVHFPLLNQSSPKSKLVGFT